MLLAYMFQTAKQEKKWNRFRFFNIVEYRNGNFLGFFFLVFFLDIFAGF